MNDNFIQHHESLTNKGVQANNQLKMVSGLHCSEIICKTAQKLTK
jgi:hypothetical protein